jgi:hypothetical protein
MVDPDEHGMGSAGEADALYPVEDAIVELAGRHGGEYDGWGTAVVGRPRRRRWPWRR